jgi:alpha-glucosidase (family GH31 glycosyl hydrolase)
MIDKLLPKMVQHCKRACGEAWQVAGINCLISIALALLLVLPANSQSATGPPPPLQHVAPEASYSASADPRAVVVVGHARFTVLTPQLIRLEWSADGYFEDHASIVFLNRRLLVPEFKVTHKGKGITIETSAIRLHYVPQANGKFNPADLSITLTDFHDSEGAPVTWRPGIADTGNLQGTTRTLDTARGDKTREPIEPGLLSRNGWTLVDDSTRPLFDSDDFTFVRGEQSIWPWVTPRPTGDRQDWYFFGYGHNYRQALADYVRVAGRIPLPPRFAFGAWWSRYWAYSDQDIEELAKSFRENDTPLDVLVIDMDWHKTLGMHYEKMDQSDHALGWDGYSWNPLLFPDPAAFLSKLHRDGLKTTLNLHPASGVQPWEDQYVAMAEAMGQNPAEKKFVPFDITNKNFAVNYMDVLHHPLEKQGVDFWWIDWQQEKNTKIVGVNPTWWLNYVHFTDQEREGKRPLLFGRWGGLGDHRYQIGFSGDTISVWESLAFQPWFTSTAANVGYAYWSHDIGGHMPGNVDPELYTRWVQFGAFSPILRTHYAKNPNSDRRIWVYPEPYSSILRSTFQVRYSLEPYIYTEARRTYDTGTAFLHPLYYDYPDDPDSYSNKDEYAFGDSMIVSPVVQPVDTVTRLTKKNIWIPRGEWLEWPSGKHFFGPITVLRSFSIDQVPIYLRAGTIIPMQPPMEYTGQKPVDPLIVNVWPLADGQSSSYTLYEDGSESELYKEGIYALTPLSATQHGDLLSIDIDPAQGGYPGMPTHRGYELRLPADWPPQAVTVNGEALALQPSDAGSQGWRYEGNTLSTIIRIAPHAVSEEIRVEVRRPAGSIGDRTQLDGFAGSITRLHSAYDAINHQWPLAWSPDPLVDALQTGDRISYHPATASAELSRFMQKYTAAQAAVKQLFDNTAAQPHKTPAEQIAKGVDASVIDQRIESYRTALESALAQLKDGEPKWQK